MRCLSEKIIPFETAQRKILVHALKVKRGNVSKAAEALHMPRQTLYRKIRGLGLAPIIATARKERRL